MEQLHVTSTKDNEKVHKLLNDLFSTDKEFQIMITVPSREGASGKTKEAVAEERLPSAKAALFIARPANNGDLICS